MIKTALNKQSSWQAATTATAAAYPALVAWANHKRMREAERDNLHDPRDPNINQDAAKAYRKQRNRTAIGGAIGSIAGHLISKKYPIARGDDEDVGDAASVESGIKTLGTMLGSHIGKMTMSKKDKDAIAKYKLHENVRGRAGMRGNDPAYRYIKDDNEKEDASIRYDHYKKKRHFSIKLKDTSKDREENPLFKEKKEKNMSELFNSAKDR